MPLLLGIGRFRKDLERHGAMAVMAPPEGGFETRLLRRLRAAGYAAQLCSARGLGDPETFLLGLHGVRPPHLGHQSIGGTAAVGAVSMALPQLMPQLQTGKPVLLWLLEAQVLSRAELDTFVALPRRYPGFHVVCEMGGSRTLRWQPLAEALAA